eukprot:TRINITY_DN18625_c0_g1_i3.p1 TRINITY_DN18625_c0_g1~~TRINITY_DN18625_c0_g1_i3.p1  ORF type:complete len:106 (-),score=4.74 TRINITY_DN18625_c0_g1_i3:223-501(-)
MPYIFVSTLFRLENGPCIVGDQNSDPQLMKYLGAESKRENGQLFSIWETKLLPRDVLNKLELKGYKVVSTSGIGQTFVITLFKPCQQDEIQE